MRVKVSWTASTKSMDVDHLYEQCIPGYITSPSIVAIVGLPLEKLKLKDFPR